MQSGRLQALPAISIGGIAATVQFAGLISPGLYQFNVTVPNGVGAGQLAISATYNGSATQSGVVLTVER